MTVPVRYALVAMVIYAAMNIVIERNFAKVSPVLNMIFFDLGMMSISLSVVLWHKTHGLELTGPPRNLIWLVVLCGVLYFIADYCFFTAYHSGGDVASVVTLSGVFPVIACAMNAATGGGLPTPRQMLAFLLAGLAVFLVGKS